MSLRELAGHVAARGNVTPILELVNSNATTRISIDRYIEASMPFVSICNPGFGDFAANPELLFAEITSQMLMEYDNWTPALRVRPDSTSAEITNFINRYHQYELAAVYYGVPTQLQARNLLADEDFYHHIFLSGRAPSEYVNATPPEKRVMISDPFKRCVRNADYPPREFFTDMNTPTGNPNGVDFGDFSIVGDHYTETGGPAYDGIVFARCRALEPCEP